MRKLAFLSTAAAALLLAGGLSAQAQQTAAPSTAKGAGAECSRTTDAKMRDDCVRQTRDHDASAAKAKKDQVTHDAKKDAAKKDSPKKTDVPADATMKGKKS
jgi:hypothetical protein